MFDTAKVEAASPSEPESLEPQHLYPGLNEASLFAQNAFVPAALHAQCPSSLQREQQLRRDMSRHTSHLTSEALPFAGSDLSHSPGGGSIGPPSGEMGSGVLSNTLDSWRTSGIRVSVSSASSIDESVDVGAQANPSGIYPLLHSFPCFDQQRQHQQRQQQQQQQQAGSARDVARPTSSTERPTHPPKGAHGNRESSSDRRPRRSAAGKGTSARAGPSTAALRAATRAAAAASVVAASAKIAAARADARAAARAAAASPLSSGRRREATGPGPSKQQESRRAAAFTCRRAQERPPCATFTLPVPGDGGVSKHTSTVTQWSDRWALRSSRSAFRTPPPERPPPPLSQGPKLELEAAGLAKKGGATSKTDLEAQTRAPSKVLSPDSEDPDFWLTGMAWTAPKMEITALPAPLLGALRSDGGEAKDDEEAALLFHHDAPSLHELEGGSRADGPQIYGMFEGGGEDAELSGITDGRNSRARKRKPQWSEEPDHSSFSPFLPDPDAPGGDQGWWGVDSFDFTNSYNISSSRGDVAARQSRQSQPFLEGAASMCTSEGTYNRGGGRGLVDPSVRITAGQGGEPPSLFFSPFRTPTPPARDSPEALPDPTLLQPPPPQLTSESVRQPLLPPLTTTTSLPSWARHPPPLLDLTVIAAPLHPPGGGAPRRSDGRSVSRPREAEIGEYRASHAPPSASSTPDPPRSTPWGCEEGGCRAPADYELTLQPKGSSGSRGRGPERRKTRWCREHRREGSELSRKTFCSFPGCRLTWSWGYELTVDTRKNPIRCCAQHKHDGMRQLRDAVEEVLDDGLDQGAGNAAGMRRSKRRRSSAPAPGG